MALSSELISQFVKVTKDEPKTNEDGVTVTGTAAEYAGAIYVQLDGSDQLTPISSSTVGIKDGDRVTVQIKNHKTTVTGNTSSPSAGSSDLDQVKEDVSDQISEFEIVIADKVSTKDFDAEKARIDNLVAENVTIKGDLTAANGKIDNLEADNVTINEKLTAAEADIDQIHTDMLTAEAADLKYATIENLEATNADVNNLEATYATVSGKLTAAEADIDKLQAESLTAESADIRYAKIDFANIGDAAIENLFTKSGIIDDLVVSEGHVTGKLVGVTIIGDLIEGGTVKADKLVVQGSDGLYYKLNVSGESVAAEQTEYNSLNGSIITANTITAEKINVDDLVAFDATIGGFKITDDSLYSGVKSSIGNTTQGIYMNDDGEMAIGDGSNFLKYYKDSTGAYKLEISADSIKMGSSSTTIEETIEQIQTGLDKTIVSTVEQFYKSSSPTELNGGNWSATQPTWTGGTYIWRRTLVTYGDGHTSYTPSEKGVCITGNTGDKGDPGDDGTSVIITSTSVDYQASINGTTPPTETWTTSIPSVPAGQYLWTRTRVNYSDGTSTTSYSVSRQGANGTPGSAGTSVTITNTAVTYAASANGTTAPSTGWQSTIPAVAAGQYLWTKTVVTYSDNKSTTAYSVSRQGKDGSDGADGKGIKSTVVTYQASTSGTTAPTGTWSSSIPSVSAGQYLWTRTVTTYTDSSSTTAYSVGRMGENGSPGSNGTSVTVSSTATTYNVHTSGTSIPTDAWSSTIPTVPAGQYLWTRVITTYSDGKSATAYSVARQGQDGSDGAPGAPGKGISSVTEYYAVSSSSTTAPSSWQTTVPTMTEMNRYLWNYESTKYTDNSTTSTSKRVIGVYGAPGTDGSPGKGISSITNYYLASASSSGVTTGTSGWTTTVQETSASKRYLWNYEKITYTDSSTATVGPRIIGTQGVDGSDGTSVTISSTSVTYQAGSSGTTVPTGNWTTSVPSVSAGQYLWTKTVVDYSDGKSTTSYSVGRMGQNGSPGADGDDGRGIKSTAVTYQAHSSQTSAPTGTWGSTVPTLTTAKPYLWTRTVITYTDSTTSTSYSVSSTLESFEIGSRNLLLDSDSDYSDTSYLIHVYTMSEKMVAGDTYTLRLWGELGEGKTNFGAWIDGGNISLGSLKDNGDGTYSMTFTGKAGTKDPSEINIYHVPSSVSATSTIDQIKLEKGNKATDWTPAPEDVDQSIGDVREDIEYMNADISDNLGSLSDELHAAQGDITNLTQTVNTTTTKVAELEQMAEGWSFNFTTIQEEITQLGDEFSTNTTETLKYIKFIDGEIWLGKDPDEGEDDFKVVISNERIRFLQNNVEIAYISNNQLYITNAQVTKRLDIGNFAFLPRQNGNLTLRFTG